MYIRRLSRYGYSTGSTWMRRWSDIAQEKTGSNVLDGKRVSQVWTEEIQREVAQITQIMKRPPGLAVVLVGSRPDSLLYVTRKQEACHRVGIAAEIHQLPEDVSQAQLEEEVQRVCADPAMDGVLVQLPLPRHLDEERAMEFLEPRKDVDGFHPLNMGRVFMRGRSPRFVPCTPLGCMELLERAGVQVEGKTAVIVGDSNIVGMPLAMLLRDRGAAAVTVCHRLSYQEWFEDEATVRQRRAAADVCLPQLPGPNLRPPDSVTICGDAATGSAHTDSSDSSSGTSGTSSDSNNNGSSSSSSSSPAGPSPQRAPHQEQRFHAHQLPSLTRSADILVVAVGHPELIKRDWVKPGAVVIDVGINVVSSSSLDSVSSFAGEGYHVVGDVAYPDVSTVAGAITPVPGGVGPMTIAAVLHNTLLAAKYRAGLVAW